MNRIITLAAVALMAMSANAQIESWNAVAADGTIDSQFGADGAWNNDLTLNPTSNVTVHFLSSGNPIEVEKSGSWATVCPTQEQWPNYSEASYKTENINIDSVDATGAQVGKHFYAMHGTGVPYTMFVGEEQMKDGASTGYWYVKSQEIGADDGNGGTNTTGYKYYAPDGSKGVPTHGFFVEITPKVAGQMKVGFWANKGGGRKLYIVDKATGKALDPATDYHAEGWVQNVKDAAGNMIYEKPMPITDYCFAGQFHTGTYDDKGEEKVVEIANQRKVGYLVWNVEANKTYMLFGSNWQFGFQGYEFTTGTTGISEVSTTATVAANAPIYNLAGQKVTKSYKGVVIQNGRKFVQK